MSKTFFELKSELQTEFWAAKNNLLVLLFWSLIFMVHCALVLCMSEVMSSFIFPKRLGLLKVHAWENPLSFVGVHNPNRVSLHEIGLEKTNPRLLLCLVYAEGCACLDETTI